MDALEWLRKHVEAKGSDLLCEMVRTFAERLMAAEVDTLCNAGYGEVRPERTNSRNGYRSRQLDSRVGSVDLSIPKLREGSYFPGWLLEPRRRTGRALLAVVAECYVRGVSTRRVEGLVQTLGIESLSKSQVSRMAGELDSEVAGFRNRPSMAASGHRPHLRALHLDLHLRTIDVAFSVRTTPRGTWPRMAEERVRR
jgi:transposase-like protein